MAKSFTEIRDGLRAAGGDAWDAIEDPGAYLRQMRGDLTWDERFADLSRDQMHDVLDAAKRRLKKIEEVGDG